MRKIVPVLGILAVLALGFSQTVSAQSGPRPEVIYGDDNRVDYYQIPTPYLKGLADSTVGLFEGGNVRIDPSGKVANLTTESYGDSYNLCSDEPFRDQFSGAFCSGSLVAPDIIMTAGHCVRTEAACQGTKFVFGFGVTQKGVNPDSVAASEVYGCTKIIAREEEGEGADFALVKLDRPVKNHKVLAINRAGTPAKGTPLFVIGHPAGLPTKLAGGAWVRDPSPSGYFVANLDTYGGNSGSAVFNATSGKVEGILVRGENDFVWDSARSCRKSNQCENEGCRGEDVTKLDALSSFIPQQGLAATFVEPGAAFSSLLKMSNTDLQ
ncbi:MAG: hypothetical protein A2X36_09200 [Elusimicrobia bacterium GWA2_69_24]|nr:MAG: hypothetical protein A2X36_09200 [Elusimicrobia bacterium GWA2_69_24]